MWFLVLIESPLLLLLCFLLLEMSGKVSYLGFTINKILQMITFIFLCISGLQFLQLEKLVREGVSVNKQRGRGSNP